MSIFVTRRTSLQYQQKNNVGWEEEWPTMTRKACKRRTSRRRQKRSNRKRQRKRRIRIITQNDKVLKQPMNNSANKSFSAIILILIFILPLIIILLLLIILLMTITILMLTNLGSIVEVESFFINFQALPAIRSSSMPSLVARLVRGQMREMRITELRL